MGLALLLTLGACGNKARLPTQELEVGGMNITVEVADQADERSQGLMYRKELAPDSGMLFVYPEPAPRSFWMQNTSIPLSIAYIDENGRVVNIQDMKPFDRTGVRSTGPALYALEMNQGWFRSKGVQAGSKVTKLPGPSEE